MPQARDGLDQLPLAVAFHAGDTHDLSRTHAQRQLVDSTLAAVVIGAEALDLEHHLHGGCRFGGGVAAIGGRHRDCRPDTGGTGLEPVAMQVDSAADHQLRQRRLAGLRRRGGAHDPALAQHDDVIGGCHDLAQLVRDEHDADALIRQPTQHIEQMVGLLRGEHRGRLVSDQHPGIAVQRLENLDPLLRANGQVFHSGVRVDMEPEPVRQIQHPAARLCDIDHPELARLSAEHDVAHDAHRRHQLEVLVHHADAAGDGVVRARQLDHLVGNHDLARIGPVQTEQHIDERALAGAVLAEQRQDPAGPQLDRDVVVRHDRAEALRDAPAGNQHFGLSP